MTTVVELTVGVFTCPECDHSQRVTMPFETAREYAEMILANLDGQTVQEGGDDGRTR